MGVGARPQSLSRRSPPDAACIGAGLMIPADILELHVMINLHVLYNYLRRGVMFFKFFAHV